MKDKFETIYTQFRLEYYKNMFSSEKNHVGTLSAQEMISAEIIYLLKSPTMKQFADFIEVSQPNATYKVRSLIEKGYINKISSLEDGREYHLEVSDKFLKNYSQSNQYGDFILHKMESSLNKEEINQVNDVITLLLEKVFKQGEKK